MTIRVLTANLWGLPWPVSHDRVGRKMRIGELLARLSPDIVGLQEVWWPWRSRFPIVPFYVPRSWRDAGLALSGRLVRDSRVDLVPFRHHGGADRLKRKGILHSVVRAVEMELRVIVTHFQAGRRHAAIRLRQAQALRALVERVREPVVCLGDFNFYAGHDGGLPRFWPEQAFATPRSRLAMHHPRSGLTASRNVSIASTCAMAEPPASDFSR